MEQCFGGRYAVRASVQAMPGGQLFEAEDLSLQRRVLVYVPESKLADPETANAMLQAASFTHNDFMHLLDVGMSLGKPYAVFKWSEGPPLAQQLRKHRMTADGMLASLYQLGLAMQEAAEEGVYGYSVLADNLWLGHGGRLLPIRYWEAAPDYAKGAVGLCNLLVQLSMKEETLPESPDMAEQRIRLALRELPAATLEAIVSLVVRTFREKLALTAFLAELRLCMAASSSSAAAGAGSRPSRPAAAYAASGAPAAYSASAASRPSSAALGTASAASESRAAYSASAVPGTAAPASRAAYEQPSQEADVDAADDEETAPAGRSRVWRRLAIVSGAACLFVVVFIGVLTFIFRLGGHDSAVTETRPKQQQPAADAGTTSAPAKSAPSQPAAGPVAADKEAGSSAAASGPTTIPKLVGLSRADAEKAALAAGLHYTFYLESNDAAQGTVFKQDPQSGAAAVRGDSVTFWVSKGK
ncbi:hypothetical protein SD70_06345 [Gordoniibacillus kamchatkensis]|uniref:PASTA domain-containing protein n=1 Tax=Gordoniibacillus kamchatkensis TaxID=1590651 RepID=A0ABR5AKG9_9BACL|nr:PASTA domain-containing protein [Paenibacillus sp. VKM B-2647]KIL41499.1 hypothetical protein SD70_06345 [Paenibacillus sp. VKM B-2647]